MDLGLSESSLFEDFRLPELFESDFSFCNDNDREPNKEKSMCKQSVKERVREREKETNLLEEWPIRVCLNGFRGFLLRLSLQIRTHLLLPTRTRRLKSKGLRPIETAWCLLMRKRHRFAKIGLTKPNRVLILRLILMFLLLFCFCCCCLVGK